MDLLSLVYVSSATSPLSSEELLSLLRISRGNNTRSGVSGMLLYKGGNFMQAIEGESDKVELLHAKIQSDPRHHGLITLLKKPIAERQFPDWSMGFRNLTGPEIVALPGYNDFLDVTLDRNDVRANPARALKLLDSFRHKM